MITDWLEFLLGGELDSQISFKKGASELWVDDVRIDC